MAESVGPTTIKVTLTNKESAGLTPLLVTKGNWLTAGGYFVELNENLRAKQEYCPGKSIHGYNAASFTAVGLGWTWNSDGSIPGIDPEWTEKLRIIKQLNIKLPRLPTGYKWKGGYPQFQDVKMGDTYLRMTIDDFIGDVLTVKHDYDLPSMCFLEKQRILVEKVEKVESVETVKVALMPGSLYAPGVPEKVAEKYNFVEHSLKGYTPTDFIGKSIPVSNLWASVAPVVPAPVPVLKENKMKSLISASKFVGSLGLRGANYWVVEPATAMAMRVVSSVRYVTFVTMLVGGIYSYYNPETAKNIANSLIPTVSISFEKPPILQGEKE